VGQRDRSFDFGDGNKVRRRKGGEKKVATLSEAKNASFFLRTSIEEGFFASLRMTNETILRFLRRG
jgi:hypothetical protein